MKRSYTLLFKQCSKLINKSIDLLSQQAKRRTRNQVVMCGSSCCCCLKLMSSLPAVPQHAFAWMPPQLSRTMATLSQMHNKGRPKVKPKTLGATFGRPQLKGIILKTMIRKPKKPNSANRKCARVRLSNGKEAVAFIPGEGHNLQEHNVVLLEGGRTQDLPGVKLKVVRGKYDCAHVVKKKQ